MLNRGPTARLVYLDLNGQACLVNRIVRVKPHIGFHAIHGSGHADVPRHKVFDRVRDGHEVGSRLRQRKGAALLGGSPAIWQTDHDAAVALGIDRIGIGHAR